FSLYGIIPVTLGVFSLLLLMLCGFFAYQYFQSVQASENKMKSFNQLTESFQNKAEKFLLVQKTLDQNKETLEWLRKQNVYLMEDLQELKARQGNFVNRHGSPLNHWVQYENHSYHQTMEVFSWLNCSHLCVSLNATFLKTERSILIIKLKLLLVSHTWIGISYKEEDNAWQWEDGSSDSPGP
ncbi:PREDICTED: C-type lectin domain family 12 member B-like, partial [Galeopterus variegatus]